MDAEKARLLPVVLALGMASGLAVAVLVLLVLSLFWPVPWWKGLLIAALASFISGALALWRVIRRTIH